MRPAVCCLLLRTWYGIAPNENHDDTEQIRDTIRLILINLVDGYQLGTDDVVRATCIRGVRATAAVRVIPNP